MGTTDLNGGALFNAEFGIRHRGSTVPERSGVALSFCRRQDIVTSYGQWLPFGTAKHRFLYLWLVWQELEGFRA
ncbi:hypothetical protein IPC324_06475 [Pseudomonas aeruginosa]|nr:hypothetical protein IPC324_06475 [Pseudomonas aeruginosa]